MTEDSYFKCIATNVYLVYKTFWDILYTRQKVITQWVIAFFGEMKRWRNIN